MSRLALVSLIVFTLCAPPVLGLAATPPVGEAPRLVLFAPWADGAALVRQAGGRPIGPLEAPMGVLAVAEDTAAFDRRVRAAGAWTVIDGRAIARLCGVSVPSYAEGSNP